MGKRIISLSLILPLALAVSAVFSAPRTALSAECFDSYGRPIECPINVGVDKKVRLESSDSYADSLAGVLDGQRLVYRLIVTNKNSNPVNDLVVKDFVIDPAERDNVKFVSSSDLTKVGFELVVQIGELLPGQPKTFLYTAVASNVGIPEGASWTVENEVRILADDEVVARDVASVTIKRGEILAAKVLPATGPSDVIATSVLLVYLGVLLRKVKLYRYL